MTKWERIEASVDLIEKVVEDYAAGWRNMEAINKIKSEVFGIRMGLGEAYISEKLAALEHDVDVLYSPRKAAKWGGSEQVKQNILASCFKIKGQCRIRQQAEAV